MNDRITDPLRAKEYFDQMLEQLRADIEDQVIEAFREDRRLAPEGVDEANLDLAIFKAVRNWLPRPTTGGTR